MDINIVQTGSAGNLTIINGTIALDMGVTVRKVSPYIKALQLVFISHIHADHCRPAAVRHLAQMRPSLRFCCGPWLAVRLRELGVPLRNIDVLETGKVYSYGNVRLSPEPLVHDVPNYGLRLQIDGERLFYAVDTATLGGITAKGYDYLLVEGNYYTDEIQERIAAKQAAGEFSYEVDAMRRHMSVEAAMDWITENSGPRTQYYLMHGHVDKEPKNG